MSETIPHSFSELAWRAWEAGAIRRGVTPDAEHEKAFKAAWEWRREHDFFRPEK